MRIYKYFLTAVLVSALILLSGCEQGQSNINDNGKNQGEENQQEKEGVEEKKVVKAYGETLKVAMRNPETLNPLVNNDQTVDQILRLSYDMLFEYDEKHKAVPNLVSNYTFSDDHRYITLSLVDGITFHDGKALTAEDVKYSFEVLLEKDNASIYKPLTSNIQRISIVNEKDVRIYFKQPYAFALNDLVIPIIPKHVYKEEGNSVLMLIGSGPYKLESFTSMKELKLTHFDQYREKVWIKDIHCTITRNADAEKTAFEQNLIDIIAPSKFDWQDYSDEKNQHLLEYTSNYYEFIGFNFNHPLLKEKSIRQGIAYAINRQQLAEKAYLNHAIITETPIQPNSWVAENLSKKSYKYDKDKALSILKNTTLTDIDGDGFYDDSKKGENILLRLLVNEENDARMIMAHTIKEDLEAIGLLVDIDAVKPNILRERLSDKDYDMVLMGWRLSNSFDFTDLFHGDRTIEGQNFIDYKNASMDIALQNIFLSRTENEILNSMEEFSDIFIDELPYFSLFFLQSAIITNDDIYGDMTISTDAIYKDIEELYISR